MLKQACYFVLLVVSVTCELNLTTPLFFDPYNPFFGCEEPIYRVPPGVATNLVCPHQVYANYKQEIEDVRKEKIFETLYYVKTEDEYVNCDARSGIVWLQCDTVDPVNKSCYPHPRGRGYFPLLRACNGYDIFRFIPKQEKDSTAIDFRPGHIYRFIATSFRTKMYLEQLQLGSCSRTKNKGDYKLRFKVYVCTDEEVKRGDCEIEDSQKCQQNCQLKNETFYQDSNGNCYMKQRKLCVSDALGVTMNKTKEIKIDCQPPSYTKWRNITTQYYSDGECHIVQERNCTFVFTGKSYTETRKISKPCEKMSCEKWKLKGDREYEVNGTCYGVAIRSCSGVGFNYVEQKEVNVTCRISQAVRGDAKEGDIHFQLYIAIGAAILALLFGMVIGVMCMRYQHNKRCPTKTNTVLTSAPSSIQSNSPSNGHTNKVFEHEVITGEIFHFGSDEIPPPPSYTSEGKQYLERSHSAFSPSSVNRSVSFHYGDESVFTSPDPIAYRHYQPRRPGRNRVNRNSSAISTAQLMRHYSDASSRQSRLTSIDLSNGGPSRQTSLKSQMPIYDEVQEAII
ncbi:uncharacterized protein LOC130662568 [Hydractinia symbiolongicarpus]|uniref:uncharacterized protein LOC130662568 n=1 Tax=Hydractinia symbiolongicarpus TaxID=13093 RepID=UPI0025508A42|nr:uncharacterized protein LOC130662568 [Hydractinia symbiolongicarpus]XP_057317446.1 uncharacterized protein LOC130662568 [Hydractinia symbiolongicarpus]